MTGQINYLNLEHVFFSGDEKIIYLDGNSLGKLPHETMKLTADLIKQQWGDRLIRSWNENWINLPEKIASKIAKIIGAKADEVFVGDTTSINLYKLASAVLASNQNKKTIVSDSLNFPTDLYVIQGLLEQHYKTHMLKLLDSRDGIRVELNSIEKIVDKNTVFLTLSHVVYKSSFMYNMEQINAMAHKKDSVVIWDLSHSAGAVPLHLNEWNADMAVGCTYKYLNGGPGAPAFLYVRKDLQENLNNPIWAWFSHQNPFDFNSDYIAHHSVRKFATSTPTIISLAAAEPGLDLILEAGIDNLRKKSMSQSRFLIEMIQTYLIPLGFTLASPAEENCRGSHVSIRHPEGYRINRAMIEPKNNQMCIIPDFRPPDNIRIGIAPLYNTFLELYDCVKRINEIVCNKEYNGFSKEKLTVT